MNTIENNKMIAEFMGFQKTTIGWYDSEETMPKLSNTYDSNTFEENELSFGVSWDWLMPVVEKIEELGYDFTASKRRNVLVYDANFMDKNNIDIVYVEDARTRKEVTYKAVVQFIKWYNEQDRFICGSCGDHVNEYTYCEDRDIDVCNNCK